MSEAVAAAEEAVAQMIRAGLAGARYAPAMSAPLAPEVALGTGKFEFDAEFQGKIVLHAVRSDIESAAREVLKAAFKPNADLSDGQFIAERIAEFARHQAISAAILESVELLEKRQFDEISRKVKVACEVGLNTLGTPGE